MSMSISSENQKLLRDAVDTGQFQTEDEALTEALRLLHNQSAQGTSKDTQLLPPDEWIDAFHTWSRKQRAGNPNMDDSRESIYEGRGE